jgi:serine/threonine protein kinase
MSDLISYFMCSNSNAEYGMNGQISTKGDVYSYGVLLLEMFTGKCPTDEKFKDGLSLHEHVANKFPIEVAEILDPRILQNDLDGVNTEMMQSCIVPMIKLGLLCSMVSPRNRLGMEQVSNAVHNIKCAFLELCGRGGRM